MTGDAWKAHLSSSGDRRRLSRDPDLAKVYEFYDELAGEIRNEYAFVPRDERKLVLARVQLQIAIDAVTA